MKHEGDCMNRGRLALAVLVTGSLLVACGGDAPSQDNGAKAPDDTLLFSCGEARGALLDLELMTSGRKRVDTSTLGSGASFVRRLADEVSAPAEVNKDIDQWMHALDAWSERLRAIEPKIENGRVVEPDTSELDKSLMSELHPIGERLANWVARVCKD